MRKETVLGKCLRTKMPALDAWHSKSNGLRLECLGLHHYLYGLEQGISDSSSVKQENGNNFNNSKYLIGLL
jgi:hypothetical protein